MVSLARRIGAAVDVGSNSVHLLVAELGADGLRHLHDESVLLGLGDAVDRQGVLLPGARRQVIDALMALSGTAHSLGAQSVTFVGTEPLRRASNGQDLVDDVQLLTGLRLHVLASLAEAQLTYLGVMAGRPPAEPTLVVDIGGGSTEVIVAAPDQPPQVHLLPSGSARLGNGILLNDPPTPNELDRLRAGARSLVGELPRAEIVGGIFVGGTATNLIRLVPLSPAGLEAAHGLLTELSQDELVGRYGVNPRRARQLPAGAAIVEALFAHFALTRAEASQASLRDGAILAAVTLGEQWLDGLPGLLSEMGA